MRVLIPLIRCALAAALSAPVLAAAGTTTTAAVGADAALQALLERSSQHATAYVDLISQLACAEHVTQFTLNDSGKTIGRLDSDFDYLVLLRHLGHELNIEESRLATPNRTSMKPQPPLLLSNGFSLMFLVFHPYYSAGFEFTNGDEVTVAGRRLPTIRFRHIRGTPSPAALAVRGREYQLELAGVAVIDPDDGGIRRMSIDLDADMADVGLRTFTATIEYAPQVVQRQTYWLPSQVAVDVASRTQHWRNVHQFSKYKRFGVATDEQIEESKP